MLRELEYPLEFELDDEWLGKVKRPTWNFIRRALRRGREYLAIRLAIARGLRNENKLTNMVFFARHPKRRGRRLKHHERQLVREWLSIRNRLVRPALRAWSTGRAPVTPTARTKPQWLRTVVPLVNRYRGDIPLDFLLGWIATESGGRLGRTTKLGERGYFQIHPGTSKSLRLDHKRLSTDPDYSVQAGIKMVQYYARSAQRIGFAYGSDLFWHVVKFLHAIPGPVKMMLKDMRQHDVQPTSWAVIKQYAAAHQPRLRRLFRERWRKAYDPVKWTKNVDKVFKRGRELAAKPASL